MFNLYKKYKIYGFRRFFSYAFSTIYRLFVYAFFRHSYSQHGEDLVLDNLLKDVKRGFYVDVGAYDPHHFSNTKRFYNKGWNGVNIEPDLRNFSKFKNIRTRDINLNIGISNKIREMNFYVFFPDTLSTFSREDSERYEKQGYVLQRIEKIKVDTLKNIFQEYAKNRDIDFLSVDVEGFDNEVLEGNDWNVYRPKLICVEVITPDLDYKNGTIKREYEVLLNNGYVKVFDNGLNAIYKSIRAK